MNTQIKLALYYYPSCFYCMMVLRFLDEMEINIELRNIVENPDWRRELWHEGGRTTVPCLRIEDVNIEWMYESADIIDYLQELIES